VRVPADLSGSDTSPIAIRQSSADNRVGLRRKRAPEKPRSSEPPAKAAPAPEPAVTVLVPRNPARSPRVWALGVVLVPLVLSCGGSAGTTPDDEEKEFRDRVQRTVERAPPDVRSRVEDLLHSEAATLDDVLEALPDHRLEGAFLGRDTHAHWVFAIVTALVFLATIPVVFPSGSEARVELGSIAFFTATAGVLMLLGFQRLAQWSLTHRTGGGVIMLFVKFIALSYVLANAHDDNILTSMIGFTCGVGLCEEVTKALPLIVHFVNQRELEWRRSLLWGLASGVGFGVAEGVMYAGRSYNGIAHAGIYAVRFLSCVGLHGIWAAAGCVSLALNQSKIREATSPATLGFFIVRALAAPIILHGLYDSLLKKESYVFALLCAIGSFGWLLSEVDRAHRAEVAGA
jgi:RsiW-degrading membrane proteinase PrsW (M82 family)